MHIKYLCLGLVLLISVFAGCTDPSSPISKIPTILIDHIEETGETKVYVHGIDDYRFANITIQINKASTTENFTYELHISTYLLKFMLIAYVWDEEKHYEYIANITVLNDDDQLKLEIEDTQHEEPVERSLPYTIIMERKE